MTGRSAPQDQRFDFCPWLFWGEADEDERGAQLGWQQALRGNGLRDIGARSFVSPLAALYVEDLVIGADSYVAAHAYLTDEVALGDRTTVNPYATVRGRVRLGDGVRVGAHAALLGFNHSMAPDEPIHRQPLVSRGITVDDDVWIGSHAVILDGVHIGAHSVVGAGAVVTRDVAPWSIVAGNPARPIRDRREPTGRPAAVGPKKPLVGPEKLLLSAEQLLAGFAERARDQAPALLQRYWRTAGEPVFVNQPAGPATVRASCDAVEIADLLTGGPPPQLPGEALAGWLASRQEPGTGLVPERGSAVVPVARHPLADSTRRYHILAVGHALDLLGHRFTHPVHAVHGWDADTLRATLDGLPWAEQAWSCGDWIDGFATGLYWNQRWFGLTGGLDTLLGWLLLHQDPWSGLWGAPSAAEGRRQPVNGSYRLTRGTFAQLGLPVPRPEAIIDSVLAHTRDARFFADGRGTACDVLDVIHPLWLCGQQTSHRRDEVRDWARQRLALVAPRWRDGAGFAFDGAPGGQPEHEPSLQGTEMWLAIVWLLADVLGESAALGYRPRGVHRPEPA